jgi:Holliday junction resolvase-like predicted endonuclease
LKVTKSSRHAKITGDFAEDLVMYWLSKYGFECARVDHTGIDLIARNPHTQEVMGISVKSRSRNTGTERTTLSIRNDNFEKAVKACDAFGCKPYFALVVDTADVIRVFLMPMRHLLKIAPMNRSQCSWRMTDSCLSRYAADSNIKCFQLHSKTTCWWGESQARLCGRGPARA